MSGVGGDGGGGPLRLLDEPVLSRLLSFSPAAGALELAKLAGDWPRLVASNRRKLTVSPETPMAAAVRAAPHFTQLRELVVDGGATGAATLRERFWAACAKLLDRLPPGAASALDRLVIRGMPQAGLPLTQSLAQLRFLEAALPRAPRFAALRALELRQVQLGSGAPRAALQCVMEALAAPESALEAVSLHGACLSVCGTSEVCCALEEGPSARRLTQLDLSVNELSIEGATRLSQALRRLRSLRTLRLSGCSLGPAGAMELASGLRSASELRELDLTQNGLGSVGVLALVPARMSLEILNLSSNWLDPDAVGETSQLLSSMADRITTLNLSANKFRARGMQDLLDQLPVMPRLRALDLAENLFGTSEFGSAGATPLARLSEVAPSLEELNLSSNRLGSDEGVMEAVARSLPSSLRKLRLAGSLLAWPKLGSLLEALPSLPQCTHLSLACARLDDDAARELADRAPLEKFPGLQALDISGNAIGPAAAARLSAALRSGRTPFRQLRGARAPTKSG